MSLLVVKNADVLVIQADRPELDIKNGAVVIEDQRVVWTGPSSALDSELRPDRVLDASGCVVLPGLVNCHHHLYQTLTRTMGTSGGKVLFDWLKFLYPLWAELDPEAVHVSAQLGLAELVLSGCTTASDHLYLFPNGSRLDDEIAAARTVGIRFHPTRGSMSLGESQGGLPPDRVCQSEDAILKDCLRVLETFHDPEPFSMLRIGLAPCSPFSVSPDLMRQSVELARRFPKAHLHTHLAETLDEERFCLERFGKRPVEYADSLGWTGRDVWFAHAVHPSSSEIDRLAHTHTGVCHCPSSNMILASGIAPVRQYLDRGVPVGLGVDGSASNDGNHLLGEARQAMLLQRVGWPGFESRADRFSAREALTIATKGGAEILGREELGSLETGKAADLAVFRVDDLAHAGALSDPVASLLTCAPGRVWHSVIAGRVVVEDGNFLPFELQPLVERHNSIGLRMRQKSGI